MVAHANLTVITKAYLPYARVLMKRLRLVEPDAAQYVFLADNVDGYFTPENEPFRVVVPSDYVSPSDLSRMTFQYNPFETCNAFKAFAHRYMFHMTACDSWAYFDSDIVPISSERCAFEEQQGASIYLTPHMLNACPDELLWLETNLLRLGIFNGGWVGIRRSAEANCFIDWLIARCRNYCFDLYRNVFVDQLWLNLTPIVLRGVHIVRHPGANIAYWNLHERPLAENSDGVLEVNGHQALFLHFSGWNPANPTIVSRHAPQLAAPRTWQRVADAYSEELQSAGLSTCLSWPYSWALYTDGQTITTEARRRFADQCIDGSWSATDDPFDFPERLNPLNPRRTWSASLRRRLARVPWIRRRYNFIR